jgi:hypothetical protein
MNHSKKLLRWAAACAALLLLAPAAFGQTGNETGGTGGNTGTPGTGNTGTTDNTGANTGTPGGTGTHTGTGGEGTAPTEAVDADVPAIYLPIPADRAAAATQAVSAFSTRLDRARNTGDNAIQLNCWVHKLGEANVDDRVIEWTRICPNLQTSPARASSVCEPPMTVPEESLYQNVKTMAEVEPANNQLHFIAFVKSEVLDLQTSFPGNDRDQFVVDQLHHLIRNVNKAKQELDAMAASTEHGGIPRHYRAMREWIARKSAEPNSLYSPCGG